MQALFFKVLADEVIQSDNPLLAALQPHFKTHRSIAWIAAFQIIGEYLKSNNMTLTKQTMERERPVIDEAVNLAMLLQVTGRKDLIRQLLRLTEKERRIPIKDKIAENPLDMTN